MTPIRLKNGSTIEEACKELSLAIDTMLPRGTPSPEDFLALRQLGKDILRFLTWHAIGRTLERQKSREALQRMNDRYVAYSSEEERTAHKDEGSRGSLKREDDLD